MTARRKPREWFVVVINVSTGRTDEQIYRSRTHAAWVASNWRMRGGVVEVIRVVESPPKQPRKDR